MPIPSLMDRLKKPKGNKVPPTGKPPAMPQPQMNATASGSPAPAMNPPKQPGVATGQPKQPKAAGASPTPGVNAEMNGLAPKNGRPSKMSKADLVEILLVKGTYKLPASSSSSTIPQGSPVRPKRPTKEKTAKDPVHKVREKDIISEKPINPEHEVTAKDSAKVKSARQKASITAKPKTESPPEIGVKAPYKAPGQFSMTSFLTHVANPGATIVNKIAHAAKQATLGKSEAACDPMVILTRKKIPSRRITPIQPKPPRETPIPEIPAQDVLVAVPLVKSAQEHVHQYVKDLKRRSGTNVLPKPVDPNAVTITKVTNGSKAPSLEAEYQRSVEAKHDPKLKAKREKVMAQTQTALAHRNKNSKDPGIAAFGQSQWKAIPAKDRLHHHINSAIDKAKSKIRGY